LLHKNNCPEKIISIIVGDGFIEILKKISDVKFFPFVRPLVNRNGEALRLEQRTDCLDLEAETISRSHETAPRKALEGMRLAVRELQLFAVVRESRQRAQGRQRRRPAEKPLSLRVEPASVSIVSSWRRL
jgi:hypothetical protein